MSDAISLDDLVRPLGAARFVTEHWMPEVPFISEPNLELVERLRTVEAFESPAALIGKLTKSIGLLGPNLFRANVMPVEALTFLEHGFVLYITGIEEQIAEVRTLSTQLASDLGAANMGVGVEAFVAKRGGISTAHFDYDINFQVLLEGEKRWHVAPNAQIRNPMQSYHPTRHTTWAINTCIEEAYARDPAIEPKLPANAQVFEARTGTTMYVPRAWWHEVESLSPCFGVNFILKGPTWASGLTQALCDVLHGDEVGREYCYGTLAESREVRAQAEQRFATIKRLAAAALDRLTLEEVFLGGRNARFVWADDANPRSLVETPEGWQLHTPEMSDEPMPIAPELVGLVKKLVPLRHPFSWEHLVVLARDEIHGEIGAIGLWNVVADLAEAGYLNRLPGRK